MGRGGAKRLRADAGLFAITWRNAGKSCAVFAQKTEKSKEASGGALPRRVQTGDGGSWSYGRDA